MRRVMTRKSMLIAVLGVGAIALAADPVQLFVRAKSTKLMSSPSPTANAVATLQPGQPVSWLGADAKNPRWHKVSVSGKTGFVFQTNLTKDKPKDELHAQGAVKVSSDGKASKGAAVKALGDGAISFGQSEPEKKLVVDQLQALDALANQVTGKQLANHSRSNNLSVAVGGDL
jgi:hypothetical protein